MEISRVLNSVHYYCMESCFVYSVQSELIIQELQVATWAKQLIITILNLGRSVIFKMDETSPQASSFCDALSSKVHLLSMCWYSLKKTQLN